MSALRIVSRTKLYWGLVLIFLIGVIFSPVSSKGHNIFLSYGNLLDVLRQVSITGLVATGMTAVILIGGIDLSVGSVMAICSVVCAMLLTVPGLTPSAAIGVPAFAIAAFVVAAALTRFLFRNLARTKHSVAGERAKLVLDRTRGVVLPVLAGAVAVALALLFALPQVETKFGVIGVLLVAPCVGLMIGAVNGLIIVGGRLQPFIVTLAMMVTALGLARLTAGQNNAVLPVYTGSNAVAEFDTLRSLVFGVFPMPGLFFIAAVIVYGAVLRFTAFGRYVYAIGGNEEAARLSGIDVARVKIATYAVSGMLAGIAAVLFVAQYRQGKPDAGAGLELDAIAAVVIGGTSLMGGRGGLAGTLVGVLIFGLLSNLLQLHNINSNLQLVLKGLIIVGTVLVQERNLGEILSNLRLGRRRGAHAESAAEGRPASETGSRQYGGDVHETP
jgi:simple sugar transport system permease protein